MVSKGFQRLSGDDWSGYISCKLIPLFYKIRTVNLGIKRGRKGYRLGLWQQRTIGSSKCLWGSCCHVGQGRTSRLTKSFTIGAGKNGPSEKYERRLSSASSGSVGLAMITDWVWRSFRTKNPWVGDSHSVYLSDFSGTGSSLESWRSIREAPTCRRHRRGGLLLSHAPFRLRRGEVQVGSCNHVSCVRGELEKGAAPTSPTPGTN
ncbi:hypothetical protein PIB30_010519 [Stylosanthes scabra]|uniref:Uncharacterized protein n=1 Tax=Stylosanthes scabra TaxID=79078 RepID=A0ABU6Q5H7_9FABA|nr:hypothetical protein [Stylosanthes scabra]